MSLTAVLQPSPGAGRGPWRVLGGSDRVGPGFGQPQGMLDQPQAAAVSHPSGSLHRQSSEQHLRGFTYMGTGWTWHHWALEFNGPPQLSQGRGV